MNEKFKTDLATGREFEEKALSILNANWYSLIKNPNERGIDLLEISWGIEIKADLYNFRKWIENGNVYIEFESYWKPSWIFKEEDYPLKKWVQCLPPSELILLDGRKFVRWVAERIEDCEQNKTLTSKWFRIVRWGDWKMTKWLLVPAAEIRKQAERTFSM